jgi:DNA-binding NarL/FixJ family response regulator
MGVTVRSVVSEARLHTAENLDDAVRRARELPGLQLVLLDLGLPGCADIEALTRFRDAFPHLMVVVISDVNHSACINAALDAGARGFIPKTSSAKVMIAAIRLVLDGGTYIPPEALQARLGVARSALAAPRSRGRAQLLTQRQTDVLRLVAKGYHNRQIAEELAVCESTVKQHLHAAFAALGISSRTEAVSIMVREPQRLL